MAKFSEKSTGLKTRHYSRRRHPDALGKNSGRVDEDWPGLLGLGTGGGAGCEVGCSTSGGAVANWASDLIGRVVVKPWERVPEGRFEVQAWAAERGHGTKSGWLCARNRS